MMRFIFLMHGDAIQPERSDGWNGYIGALTQQGVFEGGSSIGSGACFRKSGAAATQNAQIAGYILVKAKDLDEARSLLSGNPVYEAGGTVEIRPLVED